MDQNLHKTIQFKTAAWDVHVCKKNSLKVLSQIAFSTSAIVNLAAFPIGALKFLAVFLKEFKKYHKSLHWKETAGQFVRQY